MSTGFDEVRQAMVDYLNEWGISAVTAWSGNQRLRQDNPVVAVSLRGCQAATGGFQDYLGEQYNEVSGQWEEIYGRRAQLTLGLDLYARQDEGERALQTGADQLMAALCEGCPQGITLESITVGESQRDSTSGLLMRPVAVTVQVYLYAVAAAGDSFLDFKIRGGVTQ